jgi:hypothetical protein
MAVMQVKRLGSTLRAGLRHWFGGGDAGWFCRDAIDGKAAGGKRKEDEKSGVPSAAELIIRMGQQSP